MRRRTRLSNVRRCTKIPKESGFFKHPCSYPLYLDRTCKKKHLGICAISGVAYRGCTGNKEVKLTRPVIVWLLLPTGFFSWQRRSNHVREREGARCMYTLSKETLSLPTSKQTEIYKEGCLHQTKGIP
jgi:hypothetical protein